MLELMSVFLHRCSVTAAQVIHIQFFLLFLSSARLGLKLLSFWVLMLDSAVQVLAGSFVSLGGHL